jgi:hypothetical protein
MVKPHEFKVGDAVRVVMIPPDLSDSAEIDTRAVFARALGKTFRIVGFNELGHLELVVAERHPSASTYKSNTIWIEPQFVEAVSNGSTI